MEEQENILQAEKVQKKATKQNHLVSEWATNLTLI